MSDDQTGVLLEDIQDKLVGLAEAVSLIQQDISVMKPQLAKVEENTTDLKTTKTVIGDHFEQLNDHEGRLQVLEMPQRA